QAGRQDRLKAVIGAARTKAEPATSPRQSVTGGDKLSELARRQPGPHSPVQLEDVQAARKELDEIRKKALAEPDEKQLQTEYDTGQRQARDWYEPYYPVYGLFLLTFVGVFLYTILVTWLEPLRGPEDRGRIVSSAGWILFFLHGAVFSVIFFTLF